LLRTDTLPRRRRYKRQAALGPLAAQRRACAASLHVAATNAAALALYAAVGFERDALLVDYYGRGRDAVRMRVDDVRARPG
jgi:ribosomal protein S18 acetylase RimI-like enzyme